MKIILQKSKNKQKNPNIKFKIQKLNIIYYI